MAIDLTPFDALTERCEKLELTLEPSYSRSTGEPTRWRVYDETWGYRRRIASFSSNERLEAWLRQKEE